jgi:hypothetical protein
MKNHCTVNHTSDRGQADQLITNEVVHGVTACNVAAPDHDIGTKGSHFVDQFLDFAGCGPASRDEGNTDSTLADHPPGQATSETTSSADENVCGILASSLFCLLERVAYEPVSYRSTCKADKVEIRILTSSPGCGITTNLPSKFPLCSTLNAVSTSKIGKAVIGV